MAAGKMLGLVIAAALGGGVVGGLVVGAGTASVAGDREAGETAGLEAGSTDRLDELERRLGTLERQRSRRRGADRDGKSADAFGAVPDGATAPAEGAAEDSPSSGDGDSTAFGRLGLDPPDDDFVAQVAAALAVIEQRRKERRNLEQVEKRRDGFLRDLDKKLVNYRAALELTDDEIATFHEVAEAYVDDRIAAQQDGATQEDLAAMDRSARRDFQTMLGATRYRKLRALEIDSVARPVIVDASSRAGVTPEQRNRIEALLDTHIERIVDYDVRLRTEDMAEETREQIQTEVNRLNRGAWDTLRNDILTEEQRGRVPERR